MSESVAVTGMGLVAANGWGAEDYWRALMSSECHIRPPGLFDAAAFGVSFAGEVLGDIGSHLSGRERKQTDRMTQFALIASDWAIADAGVTIEDPFSTGVYTASSSGGFHFGQRELQKLWSLGPHHVSAYMSFAWFYAVNSGQISIRHDLRGPTGVVVTEQAGGLDAIAAAVHKVRRGTPMMLTGGMDSALCPYGVAAQLRSGRLSPATDVAEAYLPFHPSASGHVAAEGGCILVVEELRNALARGAVPYGIVSGYGTTFDPRPGSGRMSRLADAMTIALNKANRSPDDIGALFADGAGLPALDTAEADAIRRVFPRVPPVTVPKTGYGRAYSGAGALDVAAALLTLRDKTIPPTVNVKDGGILPLVTEPQPLTKPAVMVVGRGEGGFNSALVVESVS